MHNRFEVHAHTMFSNIRLLDSTNRPLDLIKKAIELGMSGIAITDHECLSAHVTVNKYAKKLQESNPDFKIALGNEIYLTNDRSSGQKYYHFILIAKDAIGYRAIKELSTQAWYNVYVDRKIERVPTLKSELTEIVKKYKGHLIATSACLGGELSTNAVMLANVRQVGDKKQEEFYYNNIVNFLNFALDLFGDDFYIECAPANSADQVVANSVLYNIAKAYNVKMVIGTDAHYLRPEDRIIHKSYLNSKDGDREVDAFYQYTYLMTEDEIINILSSHFPNGKSDVIEMFVNSQEIWEKIEFYSLEKKQIIPKVKVKDYPVFSTNSDFTGAYKSEWYFPTLDKLLCSSEIQERYWVNTCLRGLREKNLYKTEYLARLEIEADIIADIGEKLGDCLFAYFNTFQHYIDLFWECGSIVGPGRGSATGFLSNYLLGITQLDPVRWKLPYWRFLNKERAELPDIDIDLAPSKRPAIFEAIRRERGEFGVVQVATFGTESSKSSILTACRGYRSEEYPDGIGADEAQYLSSFVPSERGQSWSITDMIYGNPDPEKNRKPIAAFINAVNQYPGLIDIILFIGGLVKQRGSHASGVILFDSDELYDTTSLMRTPSGDLITCFDLHDAEFCGDTKYDFLVTDMSDKIISCYELLKKDGKIDKDCTLRQFYDKFLHPEIIDTTNKNIWTHLAAGDVLDVFQFATGVGLAVAKKLKPRNPLEMTSANAMMRLMTAPGEENQQDRYVRIRDGGLELFEKEMLEAGVPEDIRQIMHKHCDTYFGCCAIQEQMMELLMECADFSLAEANSARKIVAKKKTEEIPTLRKRVWQGFKDPKVAEYFWRVAVAPQLGYAFSMNHSLPYSFVGIQSILLATMFEPIYWNCACLIVNSGSLEDNSETEIVDIYDPEGDDLSNGVTFEDFPDKSAKIRKTASTDYGKVAKALGDIINRGIKVSLADINKSDFGFSVDAPNNQIIFGLKGMLHVGDDIVQTIITNRPYESVADFYNRVKPTKQVMVSLIKGGAFDSMLDRKLCMGWYLWKTCDKKKKLTLQNMPSFIKFGLLPEDTDERVTARRVYEFNRYLKAQCMLDKTTYRLDTRALDFITEMELVDLLDIQEVDNGVIVELKAKTWDKVYQQWMNIFRDWLAQNKDEVLDLLNSTIFKAEWDKYANGSCAAWEMETLCFYYHPHELAKINVEKYDLSKFCELPEEPEENPSDWFIRKGEKFYRKKLCRICGTCLSKNKNKSTVALLTPEGDVVEVKFPKDYFGLFDKRIAEPGADGKNHIVEKSWFDRGSKIIINGLRRGDNFMAKKYATTSGHQLYKINSIDDEGNVELVVDRYKGE